MSAINPRSFERFLRGLDGLTQVGSGKWFALCPAHDDRSPSLSVTDKGDRLLFHCHAGCHPEDVLAAVGCTWADVHTGDRWAQAEHAGVMAASHLAAKERARQFARIGFDIDHELLIVQFARQDLAEGKELSLESLARVKLALQRIKASRQTEALRAA